MVGRGVLWRNLGNPVRLGPVDGRAVFFILIYAFHWAWWTFILGVVAITVLFMIERYGYNIPNLMRRTRIIMGGSLRPHQTARRIRSDV